MHWGNFTAAEGGKLGVIDMASIEPAGIPEHIFRVLLAQDNDLAGPMALEFTSRTGYAIDPDRVRSLCSAKEWGHMKEWQERNPAFAMAAEKNMAVNLQKWKDLLAEEKSREPSPRQPAPRTSFSLPGSDPTP